MNRCYWKNDCILNSGKKKEGETPIFRHPLSLNKLQDDLPGIKTL